MPSPDAPIRCAIPAPAKLNLCLEVLGKRPDGFHELQTVMATVRLADSVRVEVAPAGAAVSLRSVDGPYADVPRDGTNLAVRGLEALRRATGESRGAAIDLVKRVPSQAGLGGGSSDAAAAILAGARVWGVDWPTDRLAALGETIGSDVAFFVHRLAPGGSPVALAAGRGEAITPVRCAVGAPVVILKPPVGLSTAEVYRACTPADYTPRASRCQQTLSALRSGGGATGGAPALAAAITNVLETAAIRLAPWLESLRRAFHDAGVVAHQLSGSGSAYFGVLSTATEARRVAATLRGLRLGQVFVTSVG